MVSEACYTVGRCLAGRTILVRGLRLGSVVLAVLASAFCGHDVTDVSDELVVEVKPEVVTLTAIGAVKQLRAVATDASGNTLPGTSFTWTSLAPEVISVSSNGLVTAIANGEGTVIAAVGGSRGSAAASVRQRVAKVEVLPHGASISGIGNKLNMEVAAYDSLGHTVAAPSIAWATLNPDVATIAAVDVRTAEVTARRVGQVTVAGSPEGMPAVVDYALVTVVQPAPGGPRIWLYDGPTWLNAVWGSDADNVWAVGRRGTIQKFDGSAWSRGPGLTTNNLMSVWGSAADDVWVVGGGELIFHHDGTGWTQQSPGPNSDTFHSVWGSAPNDVWAGGAFGAIRHFDGTQWSVAGPRWNLRGFWGSAEDDVWGVVEDGRIVHWDGETWKDAFTGDPTTILYAVWGSAANDVWAVGSTALHYDGVEWTAVPTRGVGGVGVWGTGPADVFAVTGSAILHYDGATWTQVFYDPDARLRAVWGSATDDIWAVGSQGSALHGVPSSPVSIDTVAMETTTLVLDGPGVPSETTATSTYNRELRYVELRVVIEQGSAAVAASGANWTCGSDTGVLLPGTCTFALDVTVPSGRLVAGSAIAHLELHQRRTTLARFAVPVVLMN